MPTAFDINDTGKQNWFYGDNARVFKILSVFLNEIEVEEIDIPQGILNSENFLNKAIYIYIKNIR